MPNGDKTKVKLNSSLTLPATIDLMAELCGLGASGCGDGSSEPVLLFKLKQEWMEQVTSLILVTVTFNLC